MGKILKKGKPSGVPPRLTSARGFTLTEIAVVLFIVALLIGSMMLPLAAQDDIRKVQDTQRTLAEARDALIGFAVANGRLPCPASATSSGLESFCTNDVPGVCGPVTTVLPSHGRCSHPYSGDFPAAQLGLSPTDPNGLLLDGWEQPIRYAVWSGTIGTTNNPLTRTDGIRSATMTSVAATTQLSVCATATGITAVDCGAATSLTSRAPALLFSIGKNGATGAAGVDEAANTNGDVVFVSHDAAPTSAANGEFDDLVIWLSPNILFNRMVAAGKLP